MGTEMERLLEDILCGGTHYLGGIHKKSESLPSLLAAVAQWAVALKKGMDEVVAGIEPSIRQSIFMSLLPAEALVPGFPGSIDVAVDDHLRALGINISDDARRTLRDACINVRRLYGLNKHQARNRTMSIGELRANRRLYQAIHSRQHGRCIWCGVSLSASDVLPTLDHVTPKHLGDDPVDGRNWALSCSSCNSGKDDSFAWSARPEAHDFIGRKDVPEAGIIGLKQRWSVLMRGRVCEHCGCSTETSELWVYRRIKTGLPVPVNCGVICEGCASTKKPEILEPTWVAQERGRGILSV